MATFHVFDHHTGLAFFTNNGAPHGVLVVPFREVHLEFKAPIMTQTEGDFACLVRGQLQFRGTQRECLDFAAKRIGTDPCLTRLVKAGVLRSRRSGKQTLWEVNY